MNQEIAGVYLSKVTISDFHCFKGENEINFTRPDGRYQQWNVILGNNNTGKTTILRLLSGLSADVRILENNLIILGPTFTFNRDILANYAKKGVKSSIHSTLQFISKTSPTTNLPKLWFYQISESGEYNSTGTDINKEEFSLHKDFIFYGYGTSRKMSHSIDVKDIATKNPIENILPLFLENTELANAESWLLQLDYAAKSGYKNAKELVDRIKKILTSGLLPDIKSIELKSELDPKTNSVKNYALFDTDYGKVRLKELGYGYQSTMAWVVDLAKKLFERYPQLDNPLTGPAIVLVDEIDLHLHPDWQRKIIKHLSTIFPNTQFIVTAHSPLVVQSAEDINLIILEKGENGQTHIRQEFGTYQGWTIEEILQDLMGLGEKTLSDRYLYLLGEFDAGLDSEDYPRAQAAYDELIPLLHPTSSQRKLLKLQLGAIAPATV